MGRYRSLFVFMDFNVFSWVLIDPYAFIWVLLGLYGFLCVHMDSNVSVWVRLGS